ncbi:MAG: hypothetical protein LQ350_001614 [Teloschistes chrysophthalmus]|nr:MAG: hypothetical protein LQ350_001614 [Niorma chrysophthalma]
MPEINFTSEKDSHVMSLLDAVRAKYGTSVKAIGNASENPITISGKQVNEVGFEEISQKQSAWSELAVVALDGLRINCLFLKAATSELPLNPFSVTSREGLKWKELSLANNLFERWAHVFEICYFARELKALRLDGNRLEKVSHVAKFPPGTCEQIERLDLANMALTWEDASLLSRTLVDLASCNIVTIRKLVSLTSLPNLEDLNLRSNPLTDLSVDRETKFQKLSRLNLASTLLPTLTSLNPLPCHFPALKALHTTYTPLAASHPHARLFTIARLPLLESLNHTIITRNERLDAELYYRGWIADLLLRAKTTDESNQIRREHPVWEYLCDIHGEPESIVRKGRENNGLALQSPKHPPVSLGANLIRFVFVGVQRTELPSPPSLPGGMTTRSDDSTSELIQDLPRQIDIYRLKSLVGRHYSIPAMYVRLVLETNEWDPVPTTQLGGLDWGGSSSNDDDDDSDDVLDISGGWDDRDADNYNNKMDDMKPSTSSSSKEDDMVGKGRRKREREEGEKKKWVRREVVIPDSTRSIGDWVEGDVARVRVERSMGEMGAEEEVLKLTEEEMVMIQH